MDIEESESGSNMSGALLGTGEGQSLIGALVRFPAVKFSALELGFQ